MSPEENNVSPGEETQNPTPELDATPEVVNPETVTTEPDETPDDPRDKTVKSLQRRVDRITAARYQAEARAQQAEREREEVRQRLAQYEQPEQQHSQAPDPLSLAKEIAKIERVTEKANGIAKDGAARFENFKAALQVVSREAGPLFDQVGRPTPLGEVCISADDPAALLHYLGSDPDLAAELADLTPIQQARRIARIEMDMSKPKEPPRSNAPKPLKPVKAVSSDVALSDQDSAEAWATKFYALRKQGKPF